MSTLRNSTFQRQANLYQQLLPVARLVLEVMFENESEDSAKAVTTFSINFTYHDGSDISLWMPPLQPEVHMLEPLAHWIRTKARELDALVPAACAGLRSVADRLQGCRHELEQACCEGPWEEVLAEFVYSVAVGLLGREAACLGSVLGGIIVQEVSQQDVLQLVESPALLLALLVQKLGEVQAKVSTAAMGIYNDYSINQLMTSFQYYTVETATRTLKVHETVNDPAFAESSFRVSLIDSFGCLMKLLIHLEGTPDLALAVDFEGVKLCRHGALCLMQMTCSDDPRLVYVLDIYMLGKTAFTMQTPQGTSLKLLLEEHSVWKVWFDPRSDADALYHQFGIMPWGIFDLQLAEVADRRSRDLAVNWVHSLHKCLTQCPALQPEQKQFAEWISERGKSLFEPLCGGVYQVFQQRPLNPDILVYAAHDTRYMLVLYEQYARAIGQQWVARVLQAGEERARWCLTPEFVTPSPEAPDF